jgi:CDP-diglyceride synthetase
MTTPVFAGIFFVKGLLEELSPCIRKSIRILLIFAVAILIIAFLVSPKNIDGNIDWPTIGILVVSDLSGMIMGKLIKKEL